MTARTVTVAAVVDPAYGERVLPLQAEMGVWVVESPANRAAWRPDLSPFANSAIYSVADENDRVTNLLNALNDIEEHFGPRSSLVPYAELIVIGLPLTAEVTKALTERKFVSFRAAGDGSIASIARDRY